MKYSVVECIYLVTSLFQYRTQENRLIDR